MSHALVHHTFRQRAVERPNAVALVEGERRVSYGELASRAERLSGSLAAAGAGPGTIVAVRLPRGIDLVVSMLATLETGAAYSVLDPGWPDGRVRTVLGHLDPAVVVDRARYESDLSATAQATRSLPGKADLAPDAACCVFFTSGTTGAPKGSASPHTALTSLLADRTAVPFDRHTVLLSTAAVAWDAFALEIWGVLLAGGTIAVAADPYPQPSTVRRSAAEHGTNTIWLTSSLFNVLVDEDVDCLRGIRMVLTGGEVMSARHARSFLSAHPNSALLNGYGPVECTIFATVHRVTPADLEAADVPIGHQVGGREVVVLRDGERCSAGEVGEIHIAGDGLALGYLGADRETAQRFVQLTLDGGSKRLYRTGDLGMVDPEGRLRFRGRGDRQVKIRGHRVDPGHVEDVARDVLSMDSVVVPVSGADGNVDRLALFCVGTQPASPDQVRDKLAEVLPNYLLPHHVVTVPAIPVTENGKTDRNALLAMLTRPRETGTEPAANDDSAVRRVERVYDELLGTGTEPGQSIIERGGTSLDLVRASARLGARFGVVVPLDRLVADSSPTAVASWIEDQPALPDGSDSADSSDGMDSSDSESVRLPALLADTWLRELATPDSATSNCVLLWRITGDVRVDLLRAALQDVHERHESLRVAYACDDVPMALLDSGCADVDLQIVRGSQDAVLAELYEPFELEEGEVWRAVVSPESDPTLLGIAVHHVAFDGWSESLLAADLSTAYRARLAGVEPTFDAAAPTLRQISADCARQSARVDLDASIAYWTDLLGDVPDLAFAPVSPNGPASSDDVAAPIDLALPAQRWAACDQLGRAHGTTAFPVLLGVYADALRAVTGQRDFAIGFPFAQRGTQRTSTAITCLTSTLCVRPPAAPLEVAVPALAEQVRQAMRSSMVSFPEVVRRLGRAGRAYADPFQTVFALQDNAAPRLDVPGWTTTYVRADHHSAVAGLSAEVLPADEGAVLHLTYQPRFVDRTTVSAVATAFDELLQEVPAPRNPSRSQP